MAVRNVKINRSTQLESFSDDIELEIKSDGKLVGIPGVSRRTLAWNPFHGKRRNVDWEKLTELSENLKLW
jgi:hypothetical protein